MLIILIMGVVALGLLVYGAAWLLSPTPAPPTSYIAPDPGQRYIMPEGWKGTPVDRRGRFVNEAYPFYQDYRQVLRWLPSHVVNLIKNSNRRYPAVVLSGNEFLYSNDILIWLGHASFYMNIRGVKILVDPQFYNAAIYGRHTPTPIDPRFFTGIDYIFISHDHEDHCDKRSLVQLFRQNPGCTVLTGLKMDSLLQSFTAQPLKIITADWYRQYPIDTSFEAFFVPSRHYCKRLGKGFNAFLWGGFVIRSRSDKGHPWTIYFEGDSGESGHFSHIGSLFSPDVAIMGIGAFMPEWFMHPNHMSPASAIKAFDDCKAAVMIPMHYGTFNLSNEDMDTPLSSLLQLAGKRAVTPLTPGVIYPI